MPRKSKRSNNKKSSSKRKNKSVNHPHNPSIQDINYNGDENSNVGHEQNISTYYQQYKEASKALAQGLCSLLPSTFRLKSVGDLARATDFIYDSLCGRNISISRSLDHIEKDYVGLEQEKKLKEFLCKVIFVPQKIINNLETNVSLRSIVTTHYEKTGANDEGHSYILKVLKKCLRKFKYCRKLTRNVKRRALKIRMKIKTEHLRDQVTSRSNNSDTFTSSDVEFDKSESSEYEDIDTSDEEYEENQTKPKPSDQEVVEEENDVYSLEQDLIEGDDRLQACLFLYSIQRLMEAIAFHYSQLKKKVSETKRSDPQYLMYSATITNKCILSIQRAEATLALDFPYLSSFYSVLALIHLPDCIAMLEENVSEQKRKKCDRGKIISFVGQILETQMCFRDVKEERHKRIVETLSRDTGLSRGKAEKIIDHIRESYDHTIPRFAINENEYIGRDRFIMYTLINLQVFFQHRIRKKKGPYSYESGPIWDENTNPASCFNEGLLFLYRDIIIPELDIWCHAHSEGHRIYDESKCHQTIPVLTILRKYTKENRLNDYALPVPASVMFSIHCILTSLIEMQGNNDVTRHAINAERSWKTLMKQLNEYFFEEWKSNGYFKTTPHALTRNIDLRNIERSRILPEPIGEENIKNYSKRFSFYNPLLAGSYLLFANYNIGLDLGLKIVNSLGQLRFVLHVYKTLETIGLLDKNDKATDLLKETYQVFKNSKNIFALKKEPKCGEFAKHFLLSLNRTATKKRDNAVNPEDISRSYRLIINHDYDFNKTNNDVETDDIMENNPQHEALESILNTADTESALYEDCNNNVSWINWAKVGCIFCDFIRKMMKELKNEFDLGDEKGEKAIKAYSMVDPESEYDIYNDIMLQFFLQPIDKDPDNEVGRKVAEFMKSYFASIEKKSYCFLIHDL